MVHDDPEQADAALALLQRATVIAIPTPVLCELAWVLKRTYARGAEAVAAAIEAMTEIDVVVTDLSAVEASLTALRAGGGFADGVIAHRGEALGGDRTRELRSPGGRAVADQRNRGRRPGGSDRLSTAGPARRGRRVASRATVRLQANNSAIWRQNATAKEIQTTEGSIGGPHRRTEASRPPAALFDPARPGRG